MLCGVYKLQCCMRYDVVVYVVNKLFGGCRDHPRRLVFSVYQINKNTSLGIFQCVSSSEIRESPNI